MAVNETRSLSQDLREGLTDGSVKKDAPDRGGRTEYNNHDDDTLQDQYGARESFGAADTMAGRLHDNTYREDSGSSGMTYHGY